MSVLINKIYYTLDNDSRTASVAYNRENTNLPNSIEIPSTVTYNEIEYKVTSVTDGAFQSLRFITSIKLNENLIKIGNSAFDSIGFSLDTLTFPSSLQELGNYAFATNNIKHVKITPNIKEIRYCPFGNNQLLETIEVDQKNPYFCNDYQYALYNKRITRLIQAPTILKIFSVPSSVSFLDKQSIDQMKNLSILYINGNIKKHQDKSINLCTALQKIYYAGKTKVNKMIYQSGTPQVIACKDYQGNFSGIEVEKRGTCYSFIKTCKMQNRNFNAQASVFVLIVFTY